LLLSSLVIVKLYLFILAAAYIYGGHTRTEETAFQKFNIYEMRFQKFRILNYLNFEIMKRL